MPRGDTFDFGGIFGGIDERKKLKEAANTQPTAIGSILSLAPLIPRNPKRI
jgi:hypothetical protein